MLENEMNVLLDITYNFGILISFGIISGFIAQKVKNPMQCAVLQGLLLGLGTIIGMLRPVELQPGVAFDGRSVMISIAGLFFGPVAALLAALMALILRIIQGGVGALMGCLVIAEAALCGIAFFYRNGKSNRKITLRQLGVLGVVVHIIMLALTIILPEEIRLNTLRQISLSVLLVYPAATVMIGSVIRAALEQSRDQEELRKREEQLRTISDNITDGMIYQLIFTTDGKRKFTFVSDSVRQLYGATREEVSQDPMLIYGKVFEEDLPLVMQKERESELSGSKYKAEIRVKNPDGTLRYSTFVSTPTKREDGSTQWDGIELVTTDKKKMEEELIRARDEAENSNKIKSQFLANMSHELRTPMNAIMGMTDLALMTELTEMQKKYLYYVQNGAKRLLLLINNILDLVKIESGGVPPALSEFNIMDLLHEIDSIYTAVIGDKRITFELSLAEPLPPQLIGDPLGLHQILGNLVGNAIKFTQQGKITLNVAIVDRSQESITLKFAVTDTGIGIPLDKMDKLFQYFSQIDGSITKKYGGSGLGLAISKALVEQMGGKIGVTSEPDQGSTFHFILSFKLP
jgi:two-component system sensor histidine kinase EvgS